MKPVGFFDSSHESWIRSSFGINPQNSLIVNGRLGVPSILPERGPVLGTNATMAQDEK